MSIAKWCLSNSFKKWNIFNFLILRADYGFPLQRPGVKAYWTLSLGPTF